MTPDLIASLLKLPSAIRVDLALILWESLDTTDQGTAFSLSPERQQELDRRWGEHFADPDTALVWEEVRTKLRSRT